MADLRRQQLDFAAHLRDPDRVPPPPGVEPRRMQVYRELFANNITSLLASTFPVSRRILGEDGWSALARQFFAGHKAQTPYFAEVPREFVEWLAARGERAAGEPPFLEELAHYEWVELALAIAEAGPGPAGIDPDGDLLDGCPVLSPLAWPLAYRWPVHRLSPEYQPAEPPAEPTFIVVHRTGDGAVGFLQVDAPTMRLLQLLGAGGDASGRVLLGQVARELPGVDLDDLLARGAQMLTLLRKRGAILGAATGA